jgi:predicted RNA-binding Zn-ribbon protein involved in translation (DUF1610 family)
LRARFPATMWLANFRGSFGANHADKFLGRANLNSLVNKLKIQEFVQLLEKQAAGHDGAIKTLQALHPKLEDGYCLYNLYEQWSQAFSYKAGRQEAFDPIFHLARKLLHYEKDETIRMFREGEWSELVKFRGPVETVLAYQCLSCRREYVSMGTSGFYDAVGLVCPNCGNVRFRSVYSKDNEMPQCSCGAHFHRTSPFDCPFCGSKQIQSMSQISPYEYFAKHTYVREEGA